jgi:hypothetical protein
MKVEDFIQSFNERYPDIDKFPLEDINEVAQIERELGFSFPSF